MVLSWWVGAAWWRAEVGLFSRVGLSGVNESRSPTLCDIIETGVHRPMGRRSAGALAKKTPIMAVS
jgi:hypothetical protein